MPKAIFGDPRHFMSQGNALTREEIILLAAAFVKLGVTKLRLTGGEPLIRHDLINIVEGLASLNGVQDIALTTNGAMLTRAKAHDLKQAGLTRITISLDSLDDRRFRQINGVDFPVAKVLAAIDNAAAAALSPVKINAVIKRGLNDQDIVPLARHFRHSGHVMRFIEFMDVGMHNGWTRSAVVSAQEILAALQTQWVLKPLPPRAFGEVATRYAYADQAGEIGIIASVTQPFCHACVRARLSADGRLFLCLFADSGLSLRDMIRQGANIEDVASRIKTIWEGRNDHYSELRMTSKATGTRMEMFQLGG